MSLCIALLTTKAASFSVLGTTRRIAPSCYYSSTLKAQEDEKANQDDEEEPKMAESTIRMDDGGSDLTNRFKYKVLPMDEKYLLCRDMSFLLTGCPIGERIDGDV